MKKIYTLAAAVMLGAICAQAGQLFVVGEATQYGWSLDDAQALLSTPENDNIYTGTLYLNGEQEFKILASYEWGGTEYGAAPDASLTDGKITLASGTNDEGYGKIKVAEDGNYLITVDTESLSATIVKSVYQESKVIYSSLFMVGSATAGSWSVDNGTPMYQNPDDPCEFSAMDIELNEGTFKIANTLKGGGTWNGKYWFFRNADNENLMALDQPDDLQWSIVAPGNYNVVANTATCAISIKPADNTGIADIEAGEAPAEYFNLQGIRVENPSAGLYIVRRDGKTFKAPLK